MNNCLYKFAKKVIANLTKLERHKWSAQVIALKFVTIELLFRTRPQRENLCLENATRFLLLYTFVTVRIRIAIAIVDVGAIIDVKCFSFHYIRM